MGGDPAGAEDPLREGSAASSPLARGRRGGPPARRVPRVQEQVAALDRDRRARDGDAAGRAPPADLGGRGPGARCDQVGADEERQAARHPDAGCRLQGPRSAPIGPARACVASGQLPGLVGDRGAPSSVEQPLQVPRYEAFLRQPLHDGRRAVGGAERDPRPLNDGDDDAIRAPEPRPSEGRNGAHGAASGARFWSQRTCRRAST
jgi:hypothetical protein